MVKRQPDFSFSLTDMIENIAFIKSSATMPKISIKLFCLLKFNELSAACCL